ncbi:hypothetical protein LUZ61_001883 [Rhynchospora tenuis]|uniref:Pentatricopeptide repeat-containing protein-mitochondrial domain-containing protein n=1 Tax=Rhynchospora tenuis TaxID=198213 RepID=A0AAD5ZHV4_9POAL|nr:hypothetical protein LUZ61_001883 [Rhynchospora tenuis]
MARQLCSSSSLTAAAHKTLTLSVSPCRLSSFLSPFSTSATAFASPSPSLSDSLEPEPTTKPTHRKETRSDMASTICHMMSSRPWTTRLQNSIRSLVPSFPQPLVLSILRNSSSRPALALQFFRWVEKTGFRHDQSTYAEIIPILTRRSMLNHARCLLLDDMPKRSVQPDEGMFVSLIEAYGRAGIPQEVVKLFNRMPELGVPRTVRSYDAFFKGILRNGRVLMAKRYFNAMLRDGVVPEVSTYNVLIWGFCLSSKMETATRFFADMKERGVVADIVTYNTMLNGWVRAKKMEDAEKLLDGMSAAGFAPNNVTYNIMIKGYVSVGMVDNALKMFEEMCEKGIRLSEKTFAGLMPGLCDDVGRAKEALDALNEMAKRKLTPKDKSVFVRLVSTMCESGDLDGAVQAHQKSRQFRNVSIDPLQYSTLIENLCKGEKYSDAVKLLNEMLKKGTLADPENPCLEATAYNPLIEYLCNNGQTKKAETFFRQLMKQGVDDTVAFNNLIKGYAKENSPELASDILNIMARREVTTEPDSHSLLVQCYLAKGEAADARTALDNMMEQGHIPSASLFRSVMEALLADGRVQTASRVMKSMVEKGVKENMDVAHQILEGLFTRGHIEEGLGRVSLFMSNDCLPDFEKLILALSEKDKVIEAYKLAEFVLERNCDVSFSTYDKLLDGLSEQGQTIPAYNLLCKIKGKGGVVDKKGCDELLAKLNEEGNTRQADILSRLLAGNIQPDSNKRGKKIAMEGY